jgi:hemoglobin
MNARNKSESTRNDARVVISISALAALLLGAIVITGFSGCGSPAKQQQKQEFFTSGSRDADQRAEERMAQDEQLTGSGEGSGEKGGRKTVPVQGAPGASANGTNTNTVVKAAGKVALYDRLGGEPGISNIVADLTPRVLNDPRVNWTRQGIKRGGLSIHHNESVEWNPTPENQALLQKHLVQFIALATGGPSHYEGKAIETAHQEMHISNPEFDAAMGDLKATLDRLQIPNQEQKELLAIFESTRPQIVTER